MPSNINSVINFSQSLATPINERVDHVDLLSAPYQATTWTHYSNSNETFTAGIWEAEACVEKFVASHEEYCHILEGSVRLTDDQGESRVFDTGDHFTIPSGFSGLWENIGTVRKAFVIATPL